MKATDKLFEWWDSFRMNYYQWRLVVTLDLIEKYLLQMKQYKRRLQNIKKLYED